MDQVGINHAQSSTAAQVAACQNGFREIKKCADAVYEAISSCQLTALEEALQNFNDMETLAHAMDFIGRRINSRDCQLSTKRISTKRGASAKDDLILELSLPRVNKILILSAKGDLQPNVIHSAPGVAGGKSSDSPAIFFYQFAKLLTLPSFAPPPLSVSLK